MIGLHMLFPQAAASNGKAENANVAFTPIAMPALCGPGAISIVISSAAHINSRHGGDPLLTYAAVIAGIAVTLIISFVVLRLASGMVRFLGHSGIDAMTRIFGFLLICIGTQFLLTGISRLLRPPHALNRLPRPVAPWLPPAPERGKAKPSAVSRRSGYSVRWVKGRSRR